jgi:superfamily II DNA or RNA helicase
MRKLRPYQEKAIIELKKHNKGKVIFPTGAGKTIVMLEDAKQRIESSVEPLTFVIVAPKILLATQLESQFQSYLKDKNIYCTHVHSGEGGTTKSSVVKSTDNLIKSLGKHHFIFTTYQSLTRINESGVGIDFCYFDEAHHSTKKSNFVGVAHTSHISKNTFFFTATPKHNDTETSMCNSTVYGGNIITIPATELVSGGYIIPPKIQTYISECTRTKDNAAFVDADNIINFLNSIDLEHPKVLVASPSTQVIMDMFTETELLTTLHDRGFTVCHITSKYGAVIDNKSVSRQIFFKTLEDLGSKEHAKFIVFHHSIISEGIDIPGMNCALLLRNLPYIDMVQTIGRIIRMNKQDYKDIEDGLIVPGDFSSYRKPFGIVSVPIKNNFGDVIERKLQAVVDALFVRGETLIV